MKNTFLLCSLLALGMTFSACKKDKDPSRTDMVTDKDWLMVAATIDPGLPNPTPGGGPITNLYNALQPCGRDDFYRFNDNMSYTYDEGASKCQLTDPQIMESGTWSWASNETILRLVPSGAGQQPSEIKIEELSGSRMKGSYLLNIGGVNHTVTATYEPKR